MKKLIFLFALMMIGVVAMGQNSIRTEGNALITIVPSSTAATSGTTTLPVMPGPVDWSIQIIPVAGGTLTSDSVYGTVRIYQSNSLGTAVWTEPRAFVTATPTSGAAGVALGHYFPLRDTIANTTVALSPGLLLEGKNFGGSRIKVHVDRPQSTDSVNYRVYWVMKYPQTNPQR